MGTGAGVVSTYEGVLRISAEQKGKYWSCLDNKLAHKWGVRQMSKHVYAQSLGRGNEAGYKLFAELAESIDITIYYDI